MNDVETYGKLSDWQPESLAGFRPGDLIDCPTLGRCEGVAMLHEILSKASKASKFRHLYIHMFCTKGWALLLTLLGSSKQSKQIRANFCSVALGVGDCRKSRGPKTSFPGSGFALTSPLISAASDCSSPAFACAGMSETPVNKGFNTKRRISRYEACTRKVPARRPDRAERKGVQ